MFYYFVSNDIKSRWDVFVFYLNADVTRRKTFYGFAESPTTIPHYCGSTGLLLTLFCLVFFDVNESHLTFL